MSLEQKETEIRTGMKKKKFHWLCYGTNEMRKTKIKSKNNKQKSKVDEGEGWRRDACVAAGEYMKENKEKRRENNRLIEIWNPFNQNHQMKN